MGTEKKNHILRRISPQEGGVRLDKCLRLWAPGLPQSLIEKAARKGLLKLEGRKVKPSQPVESGQCVQFPQFFLSPHTDTKKDSPLLLTRKERAWLKSLILYQDEEMIVVNKPAGVAVQGGTSIHKPLDTLMRAYSDASIPRLVHRLDKETSGLLVFATSLPMARWLTQAFKDRGIKKTYLAFVVEAPQDAEGIISLPLAKKPISEKIYVDLKEGLSAITHFKVIKVLENNLALLELSPKTGRTHQLRVHCKEGLGTPIVGDRKYGGNQALLLGHLFLYLHAHTLELPLPAGGRLRLEAPLPEHFKEQLGR